VRAESRTAAQRVRKHLDANIVEIHLVVVEFAPVCDGFLERGDPALQLLECLIRFEFGIALGDRVETRHAGAQLLLGRADRGYVAGRAGLIDRRPRPHHFLERLLFELHVALAGFDQFGQLVMALLEQHVDVRPSRLDVFPKADQSVVDTDEIDDESGDQG
jgi:hypothetical protein